MSLQMLRLLHLADSAFPIGATAHSFGLETVAAEGNLTAQSLQDFLCDLLWATGQVEAAFGRLAYRCADATRNDQALQHWLELNTYVAALKPARESREASATLGRRFLQTVYQLEGITGLGLAQAAARQATIEIHYCTAFGLVGGVLALGEDETVLAYLQQSMMGLVSACLRLLPLGQGRASEILWAIKAPIVAVAAASRTLTASTAASPTLALGLEHFTTFTPMLDVASMRHPTLSTRLFIS